MTAMDEDERNAATNSLRRYFEGNSSRRNKTGTAKTGAAKKSRPS
jgi:hypothetical protein